MGKGNKLKIGFIHRQPVMDQVLTTDCRTEFKTNFKARVIAEDIISYAMLKLGEMTKNDYVEIIKNSINTNIFAE